MTDATAHFPQLNDTTAFKEWALTRLANFEIQATEDPLSNGVRRLAFEISRALNAGSTTLADLQRLAKSVSDDAFVDRARRFATAHPPAPDAWHTRIESVFADVKNQPFEVLAAAVNRTRAGVVFTAHPTFANSRAARRAFAEFASEGVNGDEAAFRKRIADIPHCPDKSISLFEEHEEVMGAIGRAQDVFRKLTRDIFNWAREIAPARWTELTPTPISLASWVGYDLDGRTDIHWAQTFRLRLEEKAVQLARYAATLRAAKAGIRADALAETLSRAAALAATQASIFAGDLEDPVVVVAAANALTADHPDRLVSLDNVIGTINSILHESKNDEVRLQLCVLRSEMRAYGLGVARIHLRVNSAQVRSALHNDLGFTPERDFLDRTALSAAVDLSAVAKARHINFASVFLEKMTARRQLMLCAQFVKHVDADTPIRFLIAECEAPATVMGAIYLARLYGVAHIVDISPLFETPEAIELGGRLLERLIKEPEFVAYLRLRGRIAIQLGFSDSGRFMGQIAADLAIERLHILLARELDAQGLTDIEVVLFNTHGESVGRGGFPGTLQERFDHLLTPWTRSRYAKANLSLNAESSFQGGDGFLHFETPELTASTIMAVFDWAYAPAKHDIHDDFYKDINFSWDIYRAIKTWQEALFENSSYQAALSSFAPNLLFTTGSRKTRRQSGASKNDIARSLRAIPHNAILQQLAAPANIFGGLGFAAYRERDRFASLISGSERLQRLMKMSDVSRSLTSLSILRSYASLYDPSFWIVWARHTEDESMASEFSLIAEQLASKTLEVDLNRLADLLSVDRRKFDRVSRPDIEPGAKEKFSAKLYLLHAIRMALIMRAFTLVAALPSFSGRHEVTHAALMERAFALRFSEIADIVDQIFPVSAGPSSVLAGITEFDDGLDRLTGYPEIRDQIVTPLRTIEGIIKEISAGVAHFYGAYG